MSLETSHVEKTLTATKTIDQCAANRNNLVVDTTCSHSFRYHG